MFIPELIAFNVITGRRVWLFRDVPSGVYGDPWVASLVVVRKWWFDGAAYLMLAEQITSLSQAKGIKKTLRTLKFKRAYSIRHGEIKRYPVL